MCVGGVCDMRYLIGMWKLFDWSNQYKDQGDPKKVKEAIIKTTQIYKRDSLGHVQIKQLATFFRRKQALVSSTTSKGLEDHRRQLKWMISETLSLGEETPFISSTQINNTPEEVGTSSSKPTIKRRLHACQYKEDAHHWQQSRTTGQDQTFPENTVLWTDETKIT